MPQVFQNVDEVRKQMQRTGLSRIAPAILKLLRPSIRLVVGERSEQPVTRLGGLPNLPSEIAWPTRRSGDPHSFLAQIDLAALPTCEGLPLPRTGSLSFFCDAEYLPDPDDSQDVTDGIKVVYLPTALSNYDVRTPPRDLSREFIYDSWAFSPMLDLTAPAQNAWEISSLNLNEAESSAYCDLFTQVSTHGESVHRMGGYPNQVQYNKLDPADHWLLLLQLDSQDEAGMMWGDMGRLYFTIKQSDLESSSFNNVSMNWQCG